MSDQFFGVKKLRARNFKADGVELAGTYSETEKLFRGRRVIIGIGRVDTHARARISPSPREHFDRLTFTERRTWARYTPGLPCYIYI